MMTTKQLIEKFGIRANKNFGQNFLHDEQVICSIADASRGTPNAMEIGVGLGVVTSKLCENFEKVATIEIDRSLSGVTDFTLSGYSNHTLIYKNFLKADIGEVKSMLGDKPLTAVGNLPYNITGEIIAKLLKNHSLLEKAVIMIQKEAAQKLAATASDENYRAISVLTQYFCEIETVCDVGPECFIPAPHVTSRVIKLTFKKDLAVPYDHEKDFYIFIQNVFSKRRKLLTASFSGENKQKAVETLQNMGLDVKIRAEQMSPDQLAKFYTLIFCK